MISNYYKYNEIEYVEDILQKGFLTNHIYTEMCLLVLYYRDFLKYKPKQRKETLTRFCEEHWPDYRPEVHYIMINRALRVADKHVRLVSVGYVNVFQKDLDVIDSFAVSHDHKKLLFTLLVSLRLDRYYRMLKFDKEYTSNIFYGTDSVMRNVRKLACIPGSKDLNLTLIPDLVDAGAITPLHRGRLYLRYMDECTDSSECVLEVTCYDNIGLYYDLYKEVKGVSLCSICGKPYKKNSNRQMRCPDCREQADRETYNKYKQEYMRKYRAKLQSVTGLEN